MRMLLSRVLALLLLGCTVFAAPSHAVDAALSSSPEPPAETTPDTWEPLAGFLAAALAGNPDLVMARADYDASKERIPQARSLEDPFFSVGTMANSWFTGDGFQKTKFAASQAFPWFGTLDARERKEEKLALESGDNYGATKLSVVYEVKNAYYEYAYAERAFQVARENTALLHFLEGVAQSRYASGMGSYSDLLRIQVELDLSRDMEKSAEDMIGPAKSRLNAVMNLPPESPLPPPGPLPIFTMTLSEDDLVAGIAARNPRLAALKNREMAQAEQVELARKAYYPNFMAEVSYQFADRSNPAMQPGDDEVMAGVGLTIPLWREKRNAGLAEAKQMELSARAGREALLRSLQQQVKEACFGYRDAARKLGLYEDSLVPKAQQSLSVTLTAFSNGAAGVADLVEAQRTLLSVNLIHCRALADQASRFARLELLYGEAIPCSFRRSSVSPFKPETGAAKTKTRESKENP
ncbi:MAG: TolC family protein [Thermodesulfobacteriota bacterium]